MTDNKPMEVLKKQLMNYLIERKCAKNNQDNYRYALNGMIDYCNRNNDGYYSDEAIAKYVAEKYDIHDYYSFHSCDNHYLSQICRICKILKDLNENRIPENRYLAKTECLSISEFANAIDDFHKYYIGFGYSKGCADIYRKYATLFLEHCENTGLTNINDIDEMVINQFILTLTQYSKSTIKNCLGGLRAFFRYLYMENCIGKNLGDSIIPLKVKSQTRIPSVWQHDEVLKLLSVIDRGNPTGKRDYAMLLIVARLGIRIGDLCNLKFSNIDWSNQRIDFVQGKTQHRISLPLLKDVGWALIDYIQNGRPKIDTPYIFVTHVAPFKEFDQGNRHIFTLNAPVVCYNCGGRMHRRFDRRRKATTWWQCPECKASINISDEDMLGGITELLNEVITDPESIQIPKSDHEESQEIKRLNTEISKALNTFGFDKEAIKQKMLTCVSEKYTSLGTEEITAQSLKDIFKTVPPLTAYDSDLTDQAVSEIQLKRNGTISLVLINGQRIGKEKSA